MNLGKLVAGILEAEDPDDLNSESVRQTALSVHALLGQINAAAEELEGNFQHYSERFASFSFGDFLSLNPLPVHGFQTCFEVVML